MPCLRNHGSVFSRKINPGIIGLKTIYSGNIYSKAPKKPTLVRDCYTVGFYGV